VLVEADLPFSATLDTTDATTQAGEPDPCATPTNTVWYAITVTTGRAIVIDTAGSGYDTTLGVYVEGSQVWPEHFACNDDPDAGGTEASLVVVLGGNTTYWIQVGGNPGASGVLNLSIELAIPSDDWSDAPQIGAAALPFAGTANTSAATLQAGESQPCGAVGKSVWYAFWPPFGMAGGGDAGIRTRWSLDMTTAGSDYDTVLAVYEEGSDPLPTFRDCNDDDGASTTSTIHLDLTTSDSELMYIQVAGKSGASGNLVFSMSWTPAPANDDFADAVTLLSPDLPFSDATATRGATVVSAANPPFCRGSILRSVWYELTPSVDTQVVVDTLGSDYDTGIFVRSGGSHPLPDKIACNDDDGAFLTSSLTVNLTANVTYYFEVGASYSNSQPARYAYGCLVFNLREASQSPAPQATCGAGKQVSANLVAGGTLTSDTEADGATPTYPLEATLTTPNAGAVTIAVEPLTSPPPGAYTFLGWQAHISAPAASAGTPLLIVFRIDASMFTGSVGDIEVHRNGTLVPDCTGAGAVPDPCVASRVLLGDGDAEISVRTANASTWTFSMTLSHDFNVDTIADTVDDDPGDGSCADSTGDCSLRAAVMEANALPGADTITVPDGTYLLTISGFGENATATGDLDITDDLTITGAGAATTIVDGNHLDRLFDVRSVGLAVEIVGMTLRNGQPLDAATAARNGGAIRSLGSLSVVDSVLTSNTGTYGAAIANLGGTLTASNTVISDNLGFAAVLGEGGQTTLDQGTSVTDTTGTGVWVWAGGQLALADVIVTGSSGSGVSGAGGIYVSGAGPAIITGSVVSDNTGSTAGGILSSGSTVIISDSTIQGNAGGSAGGIAAANSSAVQLIRSTVSANDGNGITTGLSGGGGTLTVTNSTISGNTGRGIDLLGGASTSVNITSSTITANSAAGGGGGIDGLAGGVVTLKNSIIAGNTPADCDGATVTAGYNVEGDATCGHGVNDLFDTDPLLGPLADNGGQTQTHALLAGSLAINLVPAASCTVTEDQRGVARPVGTGCEAGAFEIPDGTPPVLTVPDDIQVVQTSAAGAVVSFTVTATDDVDGPLTPDCTPPSGSTFAVGTTSVLCTVADAASNVAEASFEVTVLAVGAPWAWGYNGFGQVGDSTTTNRALATHPDGLADAVSICTGQHSLAADADGSVWGWGNNLYGQVGDGTAMDRLSPVVLTGLPTSVDVECGGFHSLALAADGTVWAWGNNDDGQLGDGTTANSSDPSLVGGLSDVAAIAAGFRHSLALLADGSVWAWGWNAYGQLGDGSSASSSTPLQVPGLSDIVAVEAGLGFSLALAGDGSVWAWGDNAFGQLGDGSYQSSNTPVHLASVSSIAGLAAGDFHALAVDSDGDVWAWGANGQGQLGDGGFTSSATPVAVGALSNVIAVSAGRAHSLALDSDGSVWSWGYNGLGQLGDGGFVDRADPGAAFGLEGVTLVAAGSDTSAAIGNVTLFDTSPPVVSVPADIVVPLITPSGSVVTFSATASDDVGVVSGPTCTPPSGSLFEVGTTTV
ncbi:MAG TPA: choice-of-anchor Q domain-containing protein, partial [Ilumatobacteraceae bacterium]